MDLVKIAAKLFIKKMGASGGSLDIAKVMGGLTSLLPVKSGNLDLGSLVGMVSQNGGLASKAASWLGDGKNDESFSAGDIFSLFGEDKVQQFSNAIGTGKNDAARGLARMIPELIDNNSKGGAIIDMAKQSIGKKLLKGLFS